MNKLNKFIIFVLPAIIFISFLLLSYISIIQIDKLKHQVDKIYFGNFTQVLYLQNIQNKLKDNIIYLTIGNNKEKIIQNNKIISTNWKYYIKTYKTTSEKKVILDINKYIKLSLNSTNISLLYKTIKQIEFLIDYEVENAKKGRKVFLEDYKYLKNNLYVIITLIILFTLLIVTYIVYKSFNKFQEIEKLAHQYKIEAITDGMTGLYNKKFFNDMLDNKVKKIATKNNINVAFIILDIDYFKQYNDTYGHDAGDEALKAVARVLKEYFNQKNEYVFRLGGEEFGVLIFDITIEDLQEYLDDINKNVMALNIEHKKSLVNSILTISIGATIIKPNDTRTPKHIYIAADKMLYESKHNGRNRFTIDTN